MRPVHVKIAPERWADRIRRAEAVWSGVSRPVEGAVELSGPVPKCSMTSISSQRGHPDWPMSWPSSQKAGQIPHARGIFIRACINPYRNDRRSLLINRAEV